MQHYSDCFQNFYQATLNHYNIPVEYMDQPINSDALIGLRQKLHLQLGEVAVNALMFAMAHDALLLFNAIKPQNLSQCMKSLSDHQAGYNRRTLEGYFKFTLNVCLQQMLLSYRDAHDPSYTRDSTLKADPAVTLLFHQVKVFNKKLSPRVEQLRQHVARKYRKNPTFKKSAERFCDQVVDDYKKQSEMQFNYMTVNRNFQDQPEYHTHCLQLQQRVADFRESAPRTLSPYVDRIATVALGAMTLGVGLLVKAIYNKASYNYFGLYPKCTRTQHYSDRLSRVLVNGSFGYS
jgi:hypothetical protein